MTKEEAGKLIDYVESVYSASAAKDNKSKALKAMAWGTAFEGFTANEVYRAINEYIATDRSGFAPVPGTLIQIILSHKGIGQDDPSSLLQEYRNCLGRCGYSDHDEDTKNAYEMLPECLRKNVTIGEFWEDAIETNETQKNIRWNQIKKIVETENVRSVSDYGMQLSFQEKKKIGEHNEQG